jgi:HTH-type transcriptional regulator/antitoxin HigA
VAAAVASSLAIKGEENLTADERAYLDVLDMLIESYDDRHGEPPHAAAPNEVLKHLMDSNGMKPADLGKLLGSQPLASMVLSGKRELSKAVIVKLASHFGVSPAVFF